MLRKLYVNLMNFEFNFQKLKVFLLWTNSIKTMSGEFAYFHGKKNK